MILTIQKEVIYVTNTETQSIFNILKIKRKNYEKSLAPVIQHRNKKL